MRRTKVHAASVLFIILAASALAAAQTRDAGTRTRRAAPPEAQTAAHADEDFNLDISERRINEQDFHAETDVEAGDASARGLNLKVGVAVRAEQIDVLLRNVQGHVRFRANLEPVLRLLDARRGPPQSAPPARPDDSP